MTKHLRLIMLSLLAMICMGGYSQGKSVTCTLTGSGETIEPKGELVLSYSRPTDGKNPYGYFWNCSKGEVTVTAKLKDSNAKISKIVANAKCGKKTPKLEVTVGEQSLGQNTLTTSNKDYEFSCEQGLSGDINLLFTGKAPSSPGSYFLKTITVYYTSTASSKTPTTTTFGEGVDNNTFIVKDGETFESKVATVTPVDATGSIEYNSSDEAIAKVDAETGAITLGAKYGTAVITAKFVAKGSFANSEASYSIKHVEDFVFYESFDKCDGYGGNDNKWSGNLFGEELKPERADNPGWTFVKGRERNQCASFGSTDNGGSATSPNIQIDQKAQLKFKASRWSTDDEKSQIKISVSDGTLTYNGKNSQSVTIDVVRDTWTDYSMIVSGTNSFTVTFAGSGKNNRFFLDEVMVTPQEITLDENGDNNVEAAENVNVTLKRTFYKDGEWNTLCLPFAVADAKTAFDNAELREVDTEKSNGNTIVFKEATAIEAGKPYLIKWANSSAAAVNVEKKFEGVTLVAAATPVEVNNGGISFNGFYKMTEASELGASVAAIGAGNKLFKVTEGKMKGFRAAFVLSSGAEATGYRVVIDGTATGIEDLVIDGVKANGRVYNLNGQYVGNSLNGLQPGIYIQNGKKVVVK